jgi:hypothetical protein
MILYLKKYILYYYGIPKTNTLFLKITRQHFSLMQYQFVTLTKHPVYENHLQSFRSHTAFQLKNTICV